MFIMNNNNSIDRQPSPIDKSPLSRLAPIVKTSNDNSNKPIINIHSPKLSQSPVSRQFNQISPNTSTSMTQSINELNNLMIRKGSTSPFQSMKFNVRKIRLANIKYIDNSYSYFIKEKASNINTSKIKAKSNHNSNSSFLSQPERIYTDSNDIVSAIKENQLSFLITNNYSLNHNLSLRQYLSTSKSIYHIRQNLNYKYETYFKKKEIYDNDYEFTTNRIVKLKEQLDKLNSEDEPIYNLYIEFLKKEVEKNTVLLQSLKYDREKKSNEKNYINHAINKLKVRLEKEIRCRNLMIQIKHHLVHLPLIFSFTAVINAYENKIHREQRQSIQKKSKQFIKRTTFRKGTKTDLNVQVKVQSIYNSSPFKRKTAKNIHFTVIRFSINEDMGDQISNETYISYLDPHNMYLIFKNEEEFIDVFKQMESNNIIKEKQYLAIENDIMVMKKTLTILAHEEEKNKEKSNKIISLEAKFIEVKQQYSDLRKKIRSSKEIAQQRSDCNINSSQISKMMKRQLNLIIKPSFVVNNSEQINMEIFHRLKLKAKKEYQLIYLYLIEIITSFLNNAPNLINLKQDSESKQYLFEVILNKTNMYELNETDLRYYIVELLFYTERAMNNLFLRHKNYRSVFNSKVNIITNQLLNKKKVIKGQNLKFIHKKMRIEMIDNIAKKRNKIYILPFKKIPRPNHKRSKTNNENEIIETNSTLSHNDIIYSSSDDSMI